MCAFFCTLQILVAKIEILFVGLSGKVRAHEYPEAPKWPVSKNIAFTPPFKKTPSITYGVSFLDSEYDDNVRAVVTSHDITPNGFTLTLNTYANTSQWGMEASWMACPTR
ncbi:hypothetical protein FSP39_016988 [Pinctada imbricata]|uniref:H-type lectin domain-containing protein n=1 Tax=Pinctada imbricata TaxID=66713 RepID=A0AA88Y7W2_PINIB|nr:hypothetical protein FSP39_016988 [Pinctada imbricata]